MRRIGESSFSHAGYGDGYGFGEGEGAGGAPQSFYEDQEAW